jgi:hypothetical protein
MGATVACGEGLTDPVAGTPRLNIKDIPSHERMKTAATEAIWTTLFTVGVFCELSA